jgi:hypothetical protein
MNRHQQTVAPETSAVGPGRGFATAWLALGIAALALAGVFAILLVLARAPGLEAWFPAQDFFRTALVVHVDQSVLIWFLAFAGVVWTLTAPAGERHAVPAWLPLSVSALGCLLVAMAPFAGAASPLLNNYVPVLRHPLFLGALLVFIFGILLQILRYWLALRHAPHGYWRDPLAVGSATVAGATLIAACSLVWSWTTLPADWQGQAYYEYLFWGPGHTLQFAYTQLMLVAWLWLARTIGIRLPGSDGALTWLLLLGASPVLLVPVIHGLYAVDSPQARLAFTSLMQYGNGLGAIPISLLLIVGLVRTPAPSEADRRPSLRALQTSLLLFAVGGLLGASISGVNTIIPAHYHGSIVGVTLALMGLTYALLPRLGFARPAVRIATLQPALYAAGQLLHISGLAASGAMGIQRKTAGMAQGLDSLGAKLAMGVMGIGGLLAVIGGILFVVVVLRSLARRSVG